MSVPTSDCSSTKTAQLAASHSAACISAPAQSPALFSHLAVTRWNSSRDLQINHVEWAYQHVFSVFGSSEESGSETYERAQSLRDDSWLHRLSCEQYTRIEMGWRRIARSRQVRSRPWLRAFERRSGDSHAILLSWVDWFWCRLGIEKPAVEWNMNKRWRRRRRMEREEKN